eukprot:EG_transcript_49774
MSVGVWLELRERLSRTWASQYVKARSEGILTTPFALLAYSLDPRMQFKVGPLPSPLAAQARGYAHSVGVGNAYDMYVAAQFPYDCGVSATTQPIVWWLAGQQAGFDPQLCELALKLNSLTASSADIERNFS